MGNWFRWSVLAVALIVHGCAQLPDTVADKGFEKKQRTRVAIRAPERGVVTRTKTDRLVPRNASPKAPRIVERVSPRVIEPPAATRRAPRDDPSEVPDATSPGPPSAAPELPRAGGASPPPVAEGPPDGGPRRKRMGKGRSRPPSATRAEVPAGSATPDDPDDPRTLTLYFASTRTQTRNAGVIAVSDGRSPDLIFGKSRVRVPDAHDEGEVERPREISAFGFTLYREQTDDRKHFVIRATTWFNRGEFLQALNSTGADSALVFVHGFNVTFDQGLYRLAQIVWDTKYKGAPILFSWPSRGGVESYVRDRESAEFSRPGFVQLIRMLQDETSFPAIHVVAHSMGNQVVLDALINPGERPLKPINELILAAPDVDRDVFRGLAAHLPRVAKGVTLYVSSKDRAMVASKNFAFEPRAGEFGGPKGVVTAPNLDTIDVSPLGEELFGLHLGLNHSTFADTPSLIGDLHALINGAARPPSTRTKKISGQPEGASPFLFWRHAR